MQSFKEIRKDLWYYVDKTALELREELKNPYSVFKDVDEYLKFVFITGVTKFSKVPLFSGLNQLQDITLHPEYATICGYTQCELESVFEERLKEADLHKGRCWYNGYSWLGEPVYNPFDILLHLSEGEFRPYWFETGSPSFLISYPEHHWGREDKEHPRPQSYGWGYRGYKRDLQVILCIHSI